MSYPVSSEVSPGDATLAAHYNNLRSDSLHFGQSNLDSVNLGDVLEHYESRLSLEKLNTKQIRVPASAVEPVGLVVDGYLVLSTANVDLNAADVPTGGASVWYLFANRAADSTTFTLSVSTSATENNNQRRIGRFYYDGTKIIKDSVRTELSILISNFSYQVQSQVCNGRLTLSTGVPVPTSDISSASSLFFTPYNGNRISLYVPNYGWRPYSFSELSLDLSGLTANKNYDIFIYDNEGTLTLQAVVWSNDTLRVTSITLQDGVYCKSGAPSYRYLGTIRILAGGGAAADSVLKRYIWNQHNRVLRDFIVKESTDSWTYNTTAFRPWNNSTDNRVQFVIGNSIEPIKLDFLLAAEISSGSYAARGGIGLDSTTVSSAQLMAMSQSPSNNAIIHLAVKYIGFPGIGFHYLQLLEYGVSPATSTFRGDGGSPSTIQFGAIGQIFA